MCVCTEQRGIEGKGRGEERSRRKGISMTDSPRSGCRSAAHFISARRHTKQHSTAPILLEYRLLSSFFLNVKTPKILIVLFIYIFLQLLVLFSISAERNAAIDGSRVMPYSHFPSTLRRQRDILLLTKLYTCFVLLSSFVKMESRRIIAGHRLRARIGSRPTWISLVAEERKQETVVGNWAVKKRKKHTHVASAMWRIRRQCISKSKRKGRRKRNKMEDRK